MKKTDIILISIALILMIILIGSGNQESLISFEFSKIVRLILAIFLLFYIVSWKLIPYENKTKPEIKKLLSFYQGFNNRLHQIFKKSPHIEIGEKLKIDSLEIIVITFVLILLIIL